MTKENNNMIVECDLQISGKHVVADLSKANGYCLMKARQAAGTGVGATVIYLMAEIATFDGKKMAAPEIMALNAYDIMDLESLWASLKK